MYMIYVIRDMRYERVINTPLMIINVRSQSREVQRDSVLVIWFGDAGVHISTRGERERSGGADGWMSSVFYIYYICNIINDNRIPLIIVVNLYL